MKTMLAVETVRAYSRVEPRVEKERREARDERTLARGPGIRVGVSTSAMK
jgi:hypothetical protein